MTHREFFDLVALMRQAQKSYFQTKSPLALDKSKALEKQVDNEIKRVTAIINAQPNLFNTNPSQQ